MNAVTIRVVVSRDNAQQCKVELFREGVGDDLVENRADFMEGCFRIGAEEMLKTCGGDFLPGKAQG